MRMSGRVGWDGMDYLEGESERVHTLYLVV